MTITTTYTLADGRDVPGNSPLAMIEREVLSEHMADLWKLTTSQGRRMYLCQIERSYGAAYREKLAGMFEADSKASRPAKEPA